MEAFFGIFFSSSCVWVFNGFIVLSIGSELQTCPHFRKIIFIYGLLFNFSDRMFCYHSNRQCAESRAGPSLLGTIKQ